LDLSGPYRATFDVMLPHVWQIADPFHLVRLANQRLDEVRRRVQNQTLGHRGRKDDPLYRARRLLTKADERLDDRGRTRLLGLLDAGDPHGEVRTAWHAKEVVRSIYEINDHALAVEFVDRLAGDLQDDSCPPEIHQLGRTVKRWHTQITNWHRVRLSNGPTEAINNLVMNRPGMVGDSRPWKRGWRDATREVTREADDTSVHRVGEGSGGTAGASAA
jgi:transposase